MRAGATGTPARGSCKWSKVDWTRGTKLPKRMAMTGFFQTMQHWRLTNRSGAAVAGADHA
jgi:hypothetical protein